MIVDNLYNLDRGDAVDVNASVVQAGNRIVIGRKDEPIGMNEIHRVLHLALALKQVASFRAARRYISERSCVLKNCKPHHYGSSLPFAMLYLKGSLGIEKPFEPFIFEVDHHRYAEGNDLGERVSRIDRQRSVRALEVKAYAVF